MELMVSALISIAGIMTFLACALTWFLIQAQSQFLEQEDEADEQSKYICELENKNKKLCEELQTYKECAHTAAIHQYQTRLARATPRVIHLEYAHKGGILHAMMEAKKARLSEINRQILETSSIPSFADCAIEFGISMQAASDALEIERANFINKTFTNE